MQHYRAVLLLMGLALFILHASTASAQGDFRFDLAAKVAGNDNYTKHWSRTFPPDPKADIIIYSAAFNMSYKRMSALSFTYVTYDPLGNVVDVEKKDFFKRNYEPTVNYYVMHPGSDWIEGNYNTRIVVFDRIDRDSEEWEKLTNDPVGIANDVDKYKTFYENGGNAQDMGLLRSIGFPVAQAILNFRIDRSATLYPPDRFLLHDVRFADDNNERILGENLKVEVKVTNNYRDDGTIKLAMLIDNNIASAKDITVKGLNTSTVIFDARAGKVGTFNLKFGSDTQDVKYSRAELMFSIKNETDSSRLNMPKITVTAMNIDKEFVPVGENVTLSVTLVNNGRSGSKNITVYSNKVPVGTADVSLEFLEEKTLTIPITLKNTGINKITVTDAPSLYRNVFVEEAETPGANPVVQQLVNNPVKLSMVMVFIMFAGILFYVRRRLT
ncbi:MAG TPA: hypothetical protein VIO11_02275 [Candidatus Methanoperedens sp.]